MSKGKTDLKIKINEEGIEFITPKKTQFYLKDRAKYTNLWDAITEIVKPFKEK